MQDQNQNTQTPNPSSTVPGAAALAAKAAERALSESGAAGATGTAAGATAAKAQDAKSSNAKSTSKDTRLPNARPGMMPQNDLVHKILDKIKTSENILVALSRDPSVDEMAAAIGLTMYLDGMQKHTTAIYSGQTPDALTFLEPEGTFETNTDSLQDFIIILNKEKADNLRYKLDGDFVKVYITPYKTTISESDLEFARGDFAVDLVLALGVPTVNDLDEALSEYGRIMHDATTVDITCDQPGRFGEIEWCDPGASSVSEMVTKLIFGLQGAEPTVDKEVATALLTGIVAATGRFSNDRTNSETMQLASKLMTMGADQQLISAHVMDNDATSSMPARSDDYQQDSTSSGNVSTDNTNLLVGRDYDVYTPQLNGTVVPADVPTAGTVAHANLESQARAAFNAATSAAVNDAVMAAAANVEAVKAMSNENSAYDASGTAGTATMATGVSADVSGVTVDSSTAATTAASGAVDGSSLMLGVPSASSTAAEPVSQPKDYGQMLAEALAEPAITPYDQGGISMQQSAQMQPAAMPQAQAVQPQAQQMAQVNQAAQTAQPVNSAMQAGSPQAVAQPGVVLPPPPAPDVMAGAMPPVLPQVQVPADMAGQFKIPGM